MFTSVIKHLLFYLRHWNKSEPNRWVVDFIALFVSARKTDHEIYK